VDPSISTLRIAAIDRSSHRGGSLNFHTCGAFSTARGGRQRFLTAAGVFTYGVRASAVVHPIRLEPLDDRWLVDVASLVEDPDVRRFTRLPEPPPEGFPRTWIDSYQTGREDRTREGFAAIGASGQFLGLGLAPHIDHAAAEAELGYIVAAAAREHGVTTEILRLLTQWAFNDQCLLRVYLIIDVDNHASHRVAQRCGYQREGVMRSIHVKQHQRIDAALWSRLPADPVPPPARGSVR
jgi:RimJ/RimL family protein N-acetyltransferase